MFERLSNGGKRSLVTLASIALIAGAAAQPAGTASHGNGHSQRYLTVQKLARGISKHPLARKHMRQHVYAIERAAWRHNVSPFLMVAISGVESSFGARPCNANPRNVWGLGACDRAWQVPYFNTWDEAFGYYARFLRRTWPSARNAYELYGYCDGCSSWAAEVADITYSLWGVAPRVLYRAR